MINKKYANFVVLGLLCLVLVGSVSALSCNVVQRSACTSNRIVMGISSLNNAHGELYNQGNYDYVLCCDFPGTHTCSGTNKILGLSAETNAHAEIPSANNYNNDVCFGNLKCVSTTNECCGKYNIEMLTLIQNTNSHLSEDWYSIKICCSKETTPVPVCGDGFINQISEQCDEGSDNGKVCIPGYGSSCDYCSGSCKTITVQGDYCGDGTKQSNEQCDDGNNENGDGCSSTCVIENNQTVECGNGIVETGEQCDNGIDNGNECDPEHGSSCDYCSSSCQLVTLYGGICGNGILEDGEACDDGNLNNGDSCSSLCLREDDGDDDDDDKDDDCEPLWVCSSWSDCDDQIRTRSCEDLHKCNTFHNKPSETIECEEGFTGYSVIDLGSVSEVEEEGWLSFLKNLNWVGWLLLILFLLILLLLIIIIAILVYRAIKG